MVELLKSSSRYRYRYFFQLAPFSIELYIVLFLLSFHFLMTIQ